MQTRAVAAVAGMLVLAGCGNAHQAAGNVPTGSPPASMSNAVPYSLYTHCGIDWAPHQWPLVPGQPAAVGRLRQPAGRLG